MFKKINAMLALITYLLLISHSAASGLMMLGVARCSSVFMNMGRALMVCFVLHALLSIGIMFFNKSDSGRLYAHLNRQTVAQRISAILMLVLVHFHWMDYENYSDPAAITFLPELLFLICAYVHAGASTERVYITLGISSKALTRVTRLLLTASAVLAAAGLTAFFLI